MVVPGRGLADVLKAEAILETRHVPFIDHDVQGSRGDRGGFFLRCHFDATSRMEERS